MKALIRFFAVILMSCAALAAHAQQPGQLESLLAPIALYPDPLLSQILDASRYPDDVQSAAAWSRANPQLSGDAALATVQGTLWPPSVKALTAYPDVLARMAESPQWLGDLAAAYSADAAGVMATVQELRARAQASGYLQSNGQQQVYDQGGAIVVQPAYPSVVYAPYYDPYVVYGGWGWAYRPVFWRPWVARPVFVTRIVVAPPIRWHAFPHTVVRSAPQAFVRAAPRIVQGGPVVRPYRAVPESQRAPFVHSGGSTFIHSGGSPIVRSAPAAQAHFQSFHSSRGHDGGHHGGRR
jgi:hypothetical protein